MEKNQKENWIIAIAVAIIYLTVSILFDLWAFSWIIWVAYAIYRFVVRQLTSSLTILYLHTKQLTLGLLEIYSGSGTNVKVS